METHPPVDPTVDESVLTILALTVSLFSLNQAHCVSKRCVVRFPASCLTRSATVFLDKLTFLKAFLVDKVSILGFVFGVKV